MRVHLMAGSLERTLQAELSRGGGDHGLSGHVDENCGAVFGDVAWSEAGGQPEVLVSAGGEVY